MMARFVFLFFSLLVFTAPCDASVQISSAATKNMRCSAGVCFPTAADAVLNAGDLANMLASGDVTVNTAGTLAQNIELDAAFSWNSTHRLTLDAFYNVSFSAPVTVPGTAAVTIITNNGGVGGDLIFFPGAKLDFPVKASNLNINGQDYALHQTLHELARAIAKNPSGSYALTKDIDSAAHGAYRSSPIAKNFTGKFQGLGHTVSNLTIKGATARCTGLFNRIGLGASVSNISVLNAELAPSPHHYGRIGAVAGCSAGTIANSVATGRVAGFWVGGLLGYNDGVVTQSTANASVTGKVAGGLVGISTGLISRSRAFGPVSGHFPTELAGRPFFIGGLVGKAHDVEDSYATGDVTFVGSSYSPHNYPGAGGLIGRGEGNVRNTYATGRVQTTGLGLTGGLVGCGKKGEIKSSYALGTVISGTDGGGATGAFAGLAEAKAQNAYWDIDTSGQAKGCGKGNCAGVSGLTDNKLKSGLPAGFDPAIWAQGTSINNGYPYLFANPPPQ